MPLTEQRREELRRNWYRFANSLRSAYQQYDRAVLTLSSGFLALSIAFINQIVDLDKATGLNLLIAAWAFFVVTILFTVISYRTGEKALKHAIDNLDTVLRKDDEGSLKSKSGWSTITTVLNWLSAGSFVLAVLLLFYFVSTNLPYDMNDEKETATQNTTDTVKKGEVPVQPPPPPPESPQDSGGSTSSDSESGSSQDSGETP